MDHSTYEPSPERRESKQKWLTATGWEAVGGRGRGGEGRGRGNSHLHQHIHGHTDTHTPQPGSPAVQ